MNNNNAMKVSITSNEMPHALTPQNSLFGIGLRSGGNMMFFQKNKLKVPIATNKLISSPDKCLSKTLKSKATKKIDFESGLKKSGSERNKYTMNCPYITNKDMLLYIKNDYESGYVPNRIGNADFSTIKTPRKCHPYPKTTKFLNHNYTPLYSSKESVTNFFSKKNSHCNQNRIPQSNDTYHNWFNFSSYNDRMLNPISMRSKSSMKTFGFPFLNNSKNKQLYLQLDQSQKEMLTEYIDLFNGKTNYAQENKKNNSLNNITTLLNLNYKDSIPLTFPKCVSSINGNLTKGEKNRYDKMIDELLKVKYLISLNKENEVKIIKEFLRRHGVYNDYIINRQQLLNFGEFIQGDWNAIDINKTFKEILIAGTIKNRQKDNEKSIEQQVPIHDTNSNELNEEKEKEIFTYCSSTSKQKIKQHSNSCGGSSNCKVDIYAKLSLSKQKMLYVNESKGINDIAKDLESELLQLKLDNCHQKGNRTFSTVFPKKKIVSNSNLYLTQSKKLLKNEGGNTNMNQCSQKLILSNKINYCVLRSQTPNENSSIEKNAKKDKLSITHLNQRFYYSGLNKKELDIKAIRSSKKFTEFIVLERTKRRLALQNLKDYFQNEDDVII